MRPLTYAMSLIIILAATGASALHGAQDAGGTQHKYYLSFGQNIAQNHAATLTGTPYGGPGSYQAEFGLELLHEQSTLLFRPNVGYTRILSKDPKFYEETGTYQRVYDLLGVFVGFDLVYNVSKRLPLTLTAGPSFHSWSVERQKVVITQRNQGERALKLGWRLGLGYKINDVCRVDFTYTMTEWRSDTRGIANGGPDPNGYQEGFNPSLPSYYTLKATYSF